MIPMHNDKDTKKKGYINKKLSDSILEQNPSACFTVSLYSPKKHYENRDDKAGAAGHSLQPHFTEGRAEVRRGSERTESSVSTACDRHAIRLRQPSTPRLLTLDHSPRWLRRPRGAGSEAVKQVKEDVSIRIGLTRERHTYAKAGNK